MRGFARSALPVVAGLFVACTVIQVFLAGLGVFYRDSAFADHAGFGYLFGWLTLVLLVLALAARSSRWIAGLAALTLVLFAFQSVFVALRADAPMVAALHPLNGFAILLVGVVLTRLAWLERSAVAGSWAPAGSAGRPDVRPGTDGPAAG